MRNPVPVPAPAASRAVATPADAVAAGYRAAADAPATLRAYRADLACYRAWCTGEARDAVPATPQTVGAYLAALAPRYALATLRRRLAAIARAHRAAGHHLDAAHPAVRETLRGIARRHGIPQRATTGRAGLCPDAMLREAPFGKIRPQTGAHSTV